jgi:hypothetical protein
MHNYIRPCDHQRLFFTHKMRSMSAVTFSEVRQFLRRELNRATWPRSSQLVDLYVIYLYTIVEEGLIISTLFSKQLDSLVADQHIW